MDFSQAREVRLRPGQPVSAVFPWGTWMGSHRLTAAEVSQAAQALSGYALAAHQAELAAGFLPLEGGHRLGVCGIMGKEGIREICSLCVRFAHEIPGVGSGVFPQIQGKNTLIIGPPGAGKTTLLRDLIRLSALSGLSMGVADERGEIAACHQGAPQLDVGPSTDVVTGLKKSVAIPLLIRSMSPRMIATDELGAPGDAEAILEAARCGVGVLCTLHGASVQDGLRRGVKPLMNAGVFDAILLLRGPGQAPQIIMEKNGR